MTEARAPLGEEASEGGGVAPFRRVVVVVYDGFLLLDLSGPLGVLEIAGYTVKADYRFELVAARPGPVRSSSGVTVEAGALQPGEAIDLLLVPGGPDARKAAQDPATAALLKAASARAGRTASVGSGAFLLAAAGVLDGRRATTHMGEAAELARRFPQVSVDPASIFVEDRGVWTSGGITSGIDLALALIEQDHGFSVAKKVASGILVYYRRSARHSQSSTSLELQDSSQRFEPLLEWARDNLDACLDVERLAFQCGLSVRHFTRAFTASTGTSPAKAIEKLRLERAQAEIALGQASLEVIARRVGFGNAVRMRRAFNRAYGQSPRTARGLERDADRLRHEGGRKP